MGILNYHQLRDESGDVVPAKEILAWTLHNNTLPEVGLVAEWAEEGLLAAAGNSGFKTGIYAGVIGGEILGGREPDSIPIVDPNAVSINFNLQRAEMLDIQIPATELVVADNVFHAIESLNP